MAKININFNNTAYSIDDSLLGSATAELKTHISTVMNGEGATINLDGIAYNVDSAKLATATNDLVSYLGTITGSGSKVAIGGVEYSVDSSKIIGAISGLETTFGSLGEERLEGDGAEYYTLAPTPLSFRSDAPLNELQDVQINGVTVDPSNYTLEEGSTIVVFPIEYLKTLEKGNYEVDVVSTSKTVKGEFTVVTPELNEHSFYYNQPYTAYVAMFGENESFFIRDDGTMDVVGTPSGDITPATYSVSGDTMTVISPVVGTLTGTISADGTGIFCNELQTTFKLGDESIAADDDYIYIYNEDIGGYEVQCIDKTQAEYGAIKTGINGIDTVSIASLAFQNETLTIAPEIPDTVSLIDASAFQSCCSLESVTIPLSVSSIGRSVFGSCYSLKTINYKGTVEQWQAISLDELWNMLHFVNDEPVYIPATHVQCSDGTVEL